MDVRGIWPICGDAYIAAKWRTQQKKEVARSVLTIWWGHTWRVGHRLHEWARNVSTRGWRGHTGHHRLLGISLKKKERESGRATNLTIGIGRIRVNISTGNRLVFLIRGWRNWRWPRRNHMRRLLRRWRLDRREHLHVAFTLIRPKGIWPEHTRSPARFK